MTARAVALPPNHYQVLRVLSDAGQLGLTETMLRERGCDAITLADLRRWGLVDVRRIANGPAGCRGEEWRPESVWTITPAGECLYLEEICAR